MIFIRLMIKTVYIHFLIKIFSLMCFHSRFLFMKLVNNHIFSTPCMCKLHFEPLSKHVIYIILDEIQNIIVVLNLSLNEQLRFIVFNKFDLIIFALFYIMGILFNYFILFIFVFLRIFVVFQRCI